jgi:hypothetical protein
MMARLCVKAGNSKRKGRRESRRALLKVGAIKRN